MAKKTIINKIGNSRILWIIVSVVLALLAWVYVTRNDGDDYRDTFDNVQVVFSGEDAMREAQGLIVTEKTRDKVSVTLKGSRREISKLKDSDIQAVIDLSTITRPGTNSNYYYSVTFKPDVETNSITVESRNPRTVSFTVDRYSYKYVEVKGVFNGKIAEGFRVRQFLIIHEKAHGGAGLSASEALVDAPGGHHVERRRFLIMERAAGPEASALSLKGNIVSHHLFYAGGVKDEIYGFLRNHSLV